MEDGSHASPQDPFQVVKDEVQHSLTVVHELHKRWKEIFKSATGKDNEEYEWTKSELLSGLRSIEWDLQDLEETIGIVESNRAKFGIGDEELESRKDFVEVTRNSVATIRAEVSSMDTAGEDKSKGATMKRNLKKAGTERESLLASDGAAGSSDLTSIKVDSAAREDNTQFIDGEQSKQQQVMAEQDSQLDVISSSLGRMKDMSHEINKEIGHQGRLIDEIGEKTDNTTTQMQAAMKGLTKLAKDSDKGKLCVILVLTLILIGLCYAIFN